MILCYVSNNTNCIQCKKVSWNHVMPDNMKVSWYYVIIILCHVFDNIVFLYIVTLDNIKSFLEIMLLKSWVKHLMTTTKKVSSNYVTPATELNKINWKLQNMGVILLKKRSLQPVQFLQNGHPKLPDKTGLFQQIWTSCQPHRVTSRWANTIQV